jgi:F5/8 type C domain-containing protein
MEPSKPRRRAIPILIVGALLRVGALGCQDPEAYRSRDGVTSGVAGGGQGAGAGGAETGGRGAATGSLPTGAAGIAALAGQAGAAGADTSGGRGGGGGGSGAAGASTDQGGADGGAGAGGAGGSGGAAGVSGGAAGTAGVAGQGGAGGGAGAAAGQGGGAGAAVNYCDRTHWTATASVTAGDGAGPPGGIDGDLTTRWANNRGQDGTDSYAVDFGGAVKLTKITLNNTQAYPDDYPGAYAVYGSSDGTTFDGSPFVTGAGSTGSTVITFTQRSVRAVRVNQTGTTRAGNWWQIGEFQIGCAL